jgi:serine/threonine protein kinase
LPIKLVQSILKQLFRSLAFIHKIGYTHTDLKPENILLEKEELVRDTTKLEEYWLPKSSKIRLIDFGGATKFDEPHSTIICTRQYRPPEVILQCCDWNELADVWSVGCIAAELISG